ncbi:hypothetical protein HGA91_02570 [candidate division WWE3 bacterium]|nr:hypothetical protein [candidate division WWE3 bacterium]
MPKLDERVLVIDIGDVFAHGILYKRDYDHVELLEHQRTLRAIPDDQLIEVIQLNYKDQFDRVEVIGARDEWFSNSLRKYSYEGVALGLLIDGDQATAAYTSFGRLQRTKRFDLGWGKGVEKAMSTGGIDFLRNWFDITGYSQETPALMNYLGNRIFYPAATGDLQADFTALIGLFRYLFTQISLESMVYGNHEAVWMSDGIRRIVLTGEIFGDMLDQGDLMLAIIDSFNLEGVWEIIIDSKGVLPSTAFFIQDGNVRFENLGLIEMGSVIVLTHHFDWGTTLGQLKIDSGLSQDSKILLKSGELVRFPLEKDVKGSIELTVKPNVDIWGSETLTDLKGGSLGLVLDVRGRPLPKVDEVERIRKVYPHWRHALN